MCLVKGNVGRALHRCMCLVNGNVGRALHRLACCWCPFSMHFSKGLGCIVSIFV